MVLKDARQLSHANIMETRRKIQERNVKNMNTSIENRMTSIIYSCIFLIEPETFYWYEKGWDPSKAGDLILLAEPGPSLEDIQ